MGKPPVMIRTPFPEGSAFRINRFAFFAIFVLDPTVVLTEPPPMLESMAGRKYHYPPAFHHRRRAAPLSEPIFVARSFEVVAYRSKGCRGVNRLQD